MVIVGQAGSGPKGQIDKKYCLHGGKWKREGNREVNMRKTCRAGWRRDRCEESWVRVALQNQVKSMWHNRNQKEPITLPLHSSLMALKTPFPRAGMQI